MEDLDDVKKTQAERSHLIVLSDKDRQLVNAANVVHKDANPFEGKDAAFPTTVLIDRKGIVRWVFRPPSILSRISPDDLLKAVDEKLKSR